MNELFIHALYLTSTLACAPSIDLMEEIDMYVSHRFAFVLVAIGMAMSAVSCSDPDTSPLVTATSAAATPGPTVPIADGESPAAQPDTGSTAESTVPEENLDSGNATGQPDTYPPKLPRLHGRAFSACTAVTPAAVYKAFKHKVLKSVPVRSDTPSASVCTLSIGKSTRAIRVTILSTRDADAALHYAQEVNSYYGTISNGTYGVDGYSIQRTPDIDGSSFGFSALSKRHGVLLLVVRNQIVAVDVLALPNPTRSALDSLGSSVARTMS